MFGQLKQELDPYRQDTVVDIFEDEDKWTEPPIVPKYERIDPLLGQVTIEQAGQIATSNAMRVLVGSLVVFYFIYRWASK